MAFILLSMGHLIDYCRPPFNSRSRVTSRKFLDRMHEKSSLFASETSDLYRLIVENQKSLEKSMECIEKRENFVYYICLLLLSLI